VFVPDLVPVGIRETCSAFVYHAQWVESSADSRFFMLEQAISFTNSKGGVGKTSLVAHVGALAALSEWRTLIVELDGQSNILREFGRLQDSDDGNCLHQLLTGSGTFDPVRDVRPGLDVLPAGDVTMNQTYRYLMQQRRGKPGFLCVRDALEPLVGGYDLVLFDCPPLLVDAIRAGLAASHFFVVVTKSDTKSIDGLTLVLSLYREMLETHNPRLEMLGVAITQVGLQSTRIHLDAMEQLHDRLGGVGEILVPSLRYSESAGHWVSKRGQLTHELELIGEQSRARRFELLRRKETGKARDVGPTFNVSGLAGDYTLFTQNLLKEMNRRMAVQGRSR
jgi:chromosome partitioning protein